MSPENSEEEQADSDALDSDEEAERPRKKCIVTSPLRWRSNQFYETLQSLDRKWIRRASERSRTMMKGRKIGPAIDTPAPEGIPQWMRRMRGNAANTGHGSQNLQA